MIAQLEHGSTYMSPQSESSDVISPSAYVTSSRQLPDKRRPSAISVEYFDSDDEMGLNEPFRTNTLIRYTSDLTLNTENNTENADEEQESTGTRRKTSLKKRKESVEKKVGMPSEEASSLTDLSNSNPEIVVHEGADELMHKIPPVNPDVSRLRSESVTKVSRSSSAPQKERRKGDGSISLSRSCSEPKESKKFLRKTSKGEIITEGLPLDVSQTSISSSSLSADEVKSESDTSSLQTSLELSSSFTAEAMETPQEESNSTVFETLESFRQCESSSACAVSDQSEPYSPVSDVSSSFEAKSTDDDTCQSGRPVTRSVSAPIPLCPRETRPHSESGDQGATGETCDEDAKSATFPRRSGNRKKTSPGLKALQSLSESLEYSLKESPSKLPPQIKSPLIAQQKLQSAISAGPTSAEPPRKKTSLPRRTSPLMSRRPDSLMRSKSYSTIDTGSTSSDRVVQFLTLTSDSYGHPSNESNDYDDNPNEPNPLVRRADSESSRLPVKPDRLHYAGLEIGSRDVAERSLPIPPINAATDSRLRKKSMSLSDLLNIGRDLTSGRDKNPDKNNSHSSGKREGRLTSDTTDDRGEKAHKKFNRFRLGRSKSKSDRELKDGIASGPDIDKRKATKLFLRDSLMLESS
jgi:hypothetical protein